MKTDDYLIYSGIVVVLLTLLYLYKIKPIFDDVNTIANIARQVNKVI
jgi:hypothetical protein